MRKKKDEPREIPIEVVEQISEAEAKERDPKEEGTEVPNDEQPAEERSDGQAAAETGLAEADQTDAQSNIDELSETWEAAWSGLQAQVDALTQEKAALYDQMLRRLAEFENYRKRTERERADLYSRARAEVVLELLPVIDNFERALSSLENSGADAAGLRHGVELIHKQLKDALTKLGLQPVEAVGQAFDPHLHEAVTIEPTDEHKENTVIEEFERGYKLGDRLLRPAKVKVASAPDH